MKGNIHIVFERSHHFFFFFFVSDNKAVEDEDDSDIFTIVIPVICVTIAVACLITVFVVLRYASILCQLSVLPNSVCLFHDSLFSALLLHQFAIIVAILQKNMPASYFCCKYYTENSLTLLAHVSLGLCPTIP